MKTIKYLVIFRRYDFQRKVCRWFEQGKEKHNEVIPKCLVINCHELSNKKITCGYVRTMNSHKLKIWTTSLYYEAKKKGENPHNGQSEERQKGRTGGEIKRTYRAWRGKSQNRQNEGERARLKRQKKYAKEVIIVVMKQVGWFNIGQLALFQFK